MQTRNRLDKEPSTITNIIGIMPGEGPEADKYVILGNHRDAWVQGASDPHSGTVVLQGVAYLLGLAYRRGAFYFHLVVYLFSSAFYETRYAVFL